MSTEPAQALATLLNLARIGARRGQPLPDPGPLDAVVKKYPDLADFVAEYRASVLAKGNSGSNAAYLNEQRLRGTRQDAAPPSGDR